MVRLENSGDMFYFGFGHISMILLMCPNVNFGEAELHSWFMLKGVLVNPSKSKTSHLTPGK